MDIVFLIFTGLMLLAIVGLVVACDQRGVHK